MGYRIKTVSEMTGIPKNTLIAWERRYAIVEPARSPSGYREYTEEDIEVLKRARELVQDGLRIGEVVRLLEKEQESAPEPAALPASDGAALGQIRVALQERLLDFDRAGAERLVYRLLMVPFERAIDEIYFPLLREVGEAWDRDEITVVQEHYVTAFCREKLLVMLHSVQTAGKDAPEITCATPPGEHHELGLLALSLRLVLRGFRITYLGANVPTAQLCEHVSSRGADALCISMVHGRPQAEVVAYARDIRRRLPSAIPVAIGGRGVDREQSWPDVQGVDFCGQRLPAWLESTSAFALEQRRSS